MQGDVFRQIAQRAPRRRCGPGARVLAKNGHVAERRTHEPQHHLDQRALACAVMADEADALARAQAQVHGVDGDLRSIAVGDGAHDDGPLDVLAGLGVRLKRARQRGDHSADTVAQAVTQKLRQADIAGLKDGTARTALAVQTAVQQLHVEALQNASAMINDGRWDVGSTAPDVVGCIYTSVLDGNTCDECESADTGDVLTLDQATDLGPPNPDCAGGDKCRCQLVYVTSADPAAVTG